MIENTPVMIYIKHPTLAIKIRRKTRWDKFTDKLAFVIAKTLLWIIRHRNTIENILVLACMVLITWIAMSIVDTNSGRNIFNQSVLSDWNLFKILFS